MTLEMYIMQLIYLKNLDNKKIDNEVNIQQIIKKIYLEKLMKNLESNLPKLKIN